ncbi:MAG: ribonuclease D [Proteobacteria bacterium]|nr:ribonuclease D [Pseudomonadota bacterium]
MSSDQEYEYVDTPEALQHCCEQLSKHHFIAVDTEFLRERTYYPILGLIQLATPDYCACVDPLAFDNLDPLKDLLFDPDITKLFHAGEQDLEIFFRLWGDVPRPIFDTQIAATLIGAGECIGYAALVNKLLKVDLDKTHTRTDWLHRPLSSKQLSYAAYDVIYLAQLYPIMNEQLEKLGRLDWLSDDFATLSSKEKFTVDPDQIWHKVKGIGKLKGIALMTACKLAAWREQQAIRKDRTRKRILSDDALLDLARLQPNKNSDLKRFRHLQHSSIQNQMAALLNVISEAVALPQEQWPVIERKRPLNPDQEALLDSLMTIVRLRASDESVASGAMASRKEMERLVRGERELNILTGWRKKLVGHYLLDFIDGKYALQCSNQKLELKQQ